MRLYCPDHDQLSEAVGDSFACCLETTAAASPDVSALVEGKTSTFSATPRPSDPSPERLSLVRFDLRPGDDDRHVVLELTLPASVFRVDRVSVIVERADPQFQPIRGARVRQIVVDPDDVPKAATTYTVATTLGRPARYGERTVYFHVRVKPRGEGPSIFAVRAELPPPHHERNTRP